MSVDLRYVNPKISLFVDPGNTDKNREIWVSSKFSKFYKYKLLSATVENIPVVSLTLLQ